MEVRSHLAGHERPEFAFSIAYCSQSRKPLNLSRETLNAAGLLPDYDGALWGVRCNSEHGLPPHLPVRWPGRTCFGFLWSILPRLGGSLASPRSCAYGLPDA